MYYPLGGAPELTQVGFDAYNQEQSRDWRFLAAALAVVIVFGFSIAAVTSLSAAEPESIELPAKTVFIPPPVEEQFSPVVVPEINRSAELTAELENWVNSQTGSEWSFYVHSLGNDSLSVDMATTKRFEMASIYKLFLLRPLAQRIPSEAWGSSKVTDKTYLTCAQAMLAISDNPCAEAIAGRVGWSAAQRQIESDGYKQTVLNDTDLFVSSTADTGLLLDRLYHGDGYDASTRQISLQALSRPKGTEAIRKSCIGCDVYNKTGDLASAKHDAAIVEKDGKAYVIVIFSKNASWAQLTDSAKLINDYL